MTLYKICGYPNQKIEVKNITLPDFLTLENSTAVMRPYYDKEREKELIRPFAINHGSLRGENSVFRGFFHEGILYEIDAKTQVLTATKSKGAIFYELDKATERVVLEGTIEECINEFIKAGYTVSKENKHA